MEQKIEKTTTIEVEISEDLAVFASEYANMIGMSLQRLLCKELRRSLKATRTAVRQLPFTNLDKIIQAREDAITLAAAKQIEESKKSR